jgi:hypothetical protein
LPDTACRCGPCRATTRASVDASEARLTVGIVINPAAYTHLGGRSPMC